MEDHVATLIKTLDSVLAEMKEDRQRASEDRQRAIVALESIATFFQKQQHNIAENIAEKDDTQHSNGNNGRNGDAGTALVIRARHINLKFPVFNGTDPEGWLLRQNNIFRWLVYKRLKR